MHRRDLRDRWLSPRLVFERSNYFTWGLVYIIKRDILRKLQGNAGLLVFVLREDREIETANTVNEWNEYTLVPWLIGLMRIYFDLCVTMKGN